MTAALSITVEEIRAAGARVLDAAKAKYGPELSFDLDHYWDLPMVSAVDMDESLTAVAAGQLSDDIAEVRRSLRGDDVPIPWHDLAHLVGILRAVARRRAVKGLCTSVRLASDARGHDPQR